MNERWSVSYDVEDETDKLLDSIKLNMGSGEQTCIERGIYFVKGQFNEYQMFGRVIDVYYYVYVCRNDELCEFMMKNGAYSNGFDETTDTLDVTMYMVGNEWKGIESYKRLTHEIEHIMQVQYGIKNNGNYHELTDMAYHIASQIIASQGAYSKIQKDIAYLVYYSNSHEQDAFMQEYYQELKADPSILMTRRSETHEIFDYYTDLCNEYLQNENNQHFVRALKDYTICGYTKNSFKKMITKRLERFQKKMRNVEKHFKSGSNTRFSPN